MTNLWLIDDKVDKLSQEKPAFADSAFEKLGSLLGFWTLKLGWKQSLFLEWLIGGVWVSVDLKSLDKQSWQRSNLKFHNPIAISQSNLTLSRRVIWNRWREVEKEQRFGIQTQDGAMVDATQKVGRNPKGEQTHRICPNKISESVSLLV